MSLLGCPAGESDLGAVRGNHNVPFTKTALENVMLVVKLASHKQLKEKGSHFQNSRFSTPSVDDPLNNFFCLHILNDDYKYYGNCQKKKDSYEMILSVYILGLLDSMK